MTPTCLQSVNSSSEVIEVYISYGSGSSSFSVIIPLDSGYKIAFRSSLLVLERGKVLAIITTLVTGKQSCHGISHEPNR